MTNKLTQNIQHICAATMLTLAVSCQSTPSGKITNLDIGGQKATGAVELSSNFKYSNVELIPLESTENSLLGNLSVIGVSDDMIIVNSNDKIIFFDATSGKYLSSLGRVGRGAQEYVGISCAVADVEGKSVTIHDWASKKLVSYGFDGEYINTIANDTIAWMSTNGKNYFGFNNPQKKSDYQFCVYDKNWNTVANVDIKDETQRAGGGLLFIPGMSPYNQTVSTVLRDTVWVFGTDFALEPLAALNKGAIACPTDLLAAYDKQKERESYITFDFYTPMGDYVYARYMYGGKSYQDMWNIKSGELVYRNVIEGEFDRYLNFTANDGQVSGLPIIYKGEAIYSGNPIFVDGNEVYFALEQTYVDELGIFENPVDNPAILKITME